MHGLVPDDRRPIAVQRGLAASRCRRGVAGAEASRRPFRCAFEPAPRRRRSAPPSWPGEVRFAPRLARMMPGTLRSERGREGRARGAGQSVSRWTQKFPESRSNRKTPGAGCSSRGRPMPCCCGRLPGPPPPRQPSCWSRQPIAFCTSRQDRSPSRARQHRPAPDCKSGHPCGGADGKFSECRRQLNTDHRRYLVSLRLPLTPRAGPLALACSLCEQPDSGKDTQRYRGAS